MDCILHLLFLLTFLLLLVVTIKKSRKTANSHGLNLPPGPSSLPIIGSIHHLLSDLPHRALHLLSKCYGPIMLIRLGQVDNVVVSSPEAAAEIMKTQDLNFCSRPKIYIAGVLVYGSTDIAFAPYGPYWRQLRKICIIELLSTKRIKSFYSHFEGEVSKLVGDIAIASTAGAPVNLSKHLEAMMTNIIARSAFGGECQHKDRFMPAAKEMLNFMSGFSLVDLFPNVKYMDVLSGAKFKCKRLHRHVDEILEDIIKEHQAKKAKINSGELDEEEDLVDVLLRIKEHGELQFPLTMDNVKAVILDMFVGGSETSSTAIGWVMSELMKNPHIMKKVQAEVRQALEGKTRIADGDLGELHYLKMVIKETMRLHPPIPTLVPHLAIETTQVQGYTIPAGTRVIVNAWALGRDPRCWRDPEVFEPERFAGSHVDVYSGVSFEMVPFGAGRRICPGITYAVTATELAIASLLLRFDWELPDGMKPSELDMAESFGVTAFRKSDLCLVAKDHSKVACCNIDT